MQAINRIAARDLKTPRNLPPFACSAMDGYAVDSQSLEGAPPYSLSVSGQSLAGHPLSGRVPDGASARIFTGAAMPTGTDSVVLQEDCVASDADVRITVKVEPGDNVRPAGNDVVAGENVLSRGKRLSEFDLSWLAACGINSVEVFRRPTVAIFSTGDELKEPGEDLGPGEIFDANRTALILLLRNLPVKILDLGIIRDEPDDIRDALEGGARQCDVMITSGGVSVGDADHVRNVLESIGRLDLWRLNLKPGKPLAFGRVRDCWFFGLPGNPVSTIVTYLLLARPAILHLAGADQSAQGEGPATLRATLTERINHTPGREEYQRGRLTDLGDDPGDGLGNGNGLEVSITGDQGSNRLATFAAANCLIRVPKTARDLTPGSLVDVLPLNFLV